jgi:L-asparaginase
MASAQTISKPRIVIHGGAGNISKKTLPRASYDAYRTSLLAILSSAMNMLDKPGAMALDVATYAVSLLEDDPLFNAGKGAVFTRAGTNELESSVMVSNGYKKRGVGCMLLTRVKNPIKLAREMLIRGEESGGGGAGAHSQLSGSALEDLATKWGIEMVDPSYFWTKRRWEEHLKGLEREKGQEVEASSTALSSELPACSCKPCRERSPTEILSDAGWDGKEYLPQGTVGAVVLDSFGTICVATSTGGLTNKLPGRIGDTPTLAAGFWAEEWIESGPASEMLYRQSLKSHVSGKI